MIFEFDIQKTGGTRLEFGRKSERLSEKLESALDELKEKNTDLEKSIKLEQQLEQQQMAFFSAVSHELKTPMTSIRGYSDLLAQGVVQNDRQKQMMLEKFKLKWIACRG